MINDMLPALWSPLEVEIIVVLERLNLYNYGKPCGPKALHRHLTDILPAHQLPSQRTLARLLARNGLTHGRIGWIPEDPEYDHPHAMRVWHAIKQLNAPV